MATETSHPFRPSANPRYATCAACGLAENHRVHADIAQGVFQDGKETIHHCPTCGSAVRVVSSNEGTNHYESVADIEVEKLQNDIFNLRNDIAGTEIGYRRMAVAEITDAIWRMDKATWARLAEDDPGALAIWIERQFQR